MKDAMLAKEVTIFIKGMLFKVPLICLLLLSAGSAQAQLYKWVDSQGVTHYTTAPPPESAIHDRAVLNQQGRTTGVIRGVISDEEKAAEAARLAEEEEQKKAEAESKKRDRNLLISYKTVGEILDKRDRKLEYLESLIVDLGKARKSAKKEYDELLKQAIKAEREGKPASEELKANLRSAKREYRNSDEELKKARLERENSVTAFQEDVERFKQLKGIQ